MSGESRTFIQDQIKRGNVSINGSTVNKASQKVHSSDSVTGHFKEDSNCLLEPVPFSLDVLYEDSDLLLVNKPQDMVIHPASGYKGPTLVHYLLYYFRKLPAFKETKEERPGIVHRLDRGTSGVILIAKHRRSQDLLSQLFKSRQILKEYEAIVWGRAPKQGHIENKIGRDIRDRKKMSSSTEKGRIAITDFSLASASLSFSHVAVFPKTGRTHQIRVHLAENRLPIVGDPLYGPKSLRNQIDKLDPLLKAAVANTTATYLHAMRLTFTHPLSGKTLSIEAKRPPNFDKFLGLMKTADS